MTQLLYEKKVKIVSLTFCLNFKITISNQTGRAHSLYLYYMYTLSKNDHWEQKTTETGTGLHYCFAYSLIAIFIKANEELSRLFGRERQVPFSR